MCPSHAFYKALLLTVCTIYVCPAIKAWFEHCICNAGNQRNGFLLVCLGFCSASQTFTILSAVMTVSSGASLRSALMQEPCSCLLCQQSCGTCALPRLLMCIMRVRFCMQCFCGSSHCSHLSAICARVVRMDTIQLDC